ncbi:DNA photolyase phr1 [Sporothrix eucalyptigena]|uniref:DNA photolyase phr1 n=1 Tax=Sporothrix eucalyptigena TaxID=1812306 RepID=A0ABP0B9H2_9PEZI
MPTAPSKRKASNGSPSSSSGASEHVNGTKGTNGSSSTKKAKTTKSSSRSSNTSDPLRRPHPLHEVGEQNGVILRQFYPAEMSTARVMAYINGDLPTPMDVLNRTIEETASQIAQVDLPDKGSPVVHWFKSDLRVHDNRGLRQASTLAQENSAPLIGLYIVSPQDWEAHNTAPVRVDLVLRTLSVLKDDLARLNIPLWIETVEDRKQVPSRITELMDKWNARHLFANLEYEPDEVRRETKLLRLCASQGKALTVVHDTCAVPPGELTSGSGKQYAIYTPWYRAFKQHIHDNEEVIDLVDAPEKQLDSVRKEIPKELFSSKIPEAPEGKRLTNDEKTRFRELWPAGENEATSRLEQFCEHRMAEYADKRDIPSAGATSALSPYLATGAISARTIIHTASDRASASSLDKGNNGFRVWVSEVAWRDFYKHVLVGWPHIAMNKPFKPEYANIHWADEDADAKLKAWTQGRTGYPFIDAAMRQLLHEGWMHNRSRMVVASFLSKDLLIDWRRGEQWFMRHLVDGDVASNIGGWGFSASVGVDPQPYFRVFNPYRQSERFDPDGEYIRQWVPELADIEDNKFIHEPYGNGDAADKARKAGYPEPIVDHKKAREAALTVYKRALGRE